MIRTCRPWMIPVLAIASACARRPAGPPEPQAQRIRRRCGFWSAAKNSGRVGGAVGQPVVVQVNDASGAAVAAASGALHGSGERRFPAGSWLDRFRRPVHHQREPRQRGGTVSDCSPTTDSSGKRAEVRIEEIALGTRSLLGQQLNQVHCIRCHDPNPPRSECPIMITSPPRPMRLRTEQS